MLLTVPQAAERLGLAEGTLRNWMYQRKIEFVKIGGTAKIREAEVERIIAEGTVPVGGDDA